mgnify:CR=1 FL=1
MKRFQLRQGEPADEAAYLDRRPLGNRLSSSTRAPPRSSRNSTDDASGRKSTAPITADTDY